MGELSVRRPRSGSKSSQLSPARSHVIGTVLTCHPTSDRELGIDLSLEHSAEAIGHRQCALRIYISLERKIVSLEIPVTVLDGQIRRKAQIGTCRRVFRGDGRTTITS